MQTDRTTKVLLLLIAVALWAGLIRGILTPSPVVAQGGVSDVNIQKIAGMPLLIKEGDGQLYVQSAVAPKALRIVTGKP